MQTENNITIGIIGSGMIGSSLAALFSGNGYQVKVFVRSQKSSDKLWKAINEIYEEIEKRGLITKDQSKACRRNIYAVSHYQDMCDVGVVFETVSEVVEVKAEVYKNIETYCNECRALISTSSAMSPDDLVQHVKRYKNKFMVAHPFNPPHLVPFVEMVPSQYTSSESEKFAYDLLEKVGRKVCVMKKSAPGFIANRLQHALLREAFYMIEQGLCSPEDIDKALMYSFMPRYTSVGLFEHQDAAGLDLVRNIEQYLFPSLCNSVKVSSVLNTACQEGKLGQKSGQGVYKWDKESISDFKKRAAEPYWRFFNWKCSSN